MSVIKNQSDPRFTRITNAKIDNLYMQIPHQHCHWLLIIRYKNDDNDFFEHYHNIFMDDSTLLSSILELHNEYHINKKTDKRVISAHGMCDIDMYIHDNKFIIYWSPNDGSYIYFEFELSEFEELVNKIKYHSKLDGNQNNKKRKKSR